MGTARAVSDRYTDLINAHDAAAIGEFFAEDGVLVDPSGEFKGRSAIVDYWEGFFRAFPAMVGADEFKAESGNTAINEWSASGSHDGPLDSPEGAIPATGKTVSIRGVDAITVERGLITSQRVYYDQLSFMVQLGLMPEPAAAGA